LCWENMCQKFAKLLSKPSRHPSIGILKKEY
jgi:hypothetical protein